MAGHLSLVIKWIFFLIVPVATRYLDITMEVNNQSLKLPYFFTISEVLFY